MNWNHAVSWGWGFGLALAILVGLGRVGRYIQTHNFEFWTAQRTDSAAATAAAAAAAPGVETKRNQRRSQNQPTRYYDQAPAMNWDHAVSWGWGVWVSVSDIGRVGSGWPLGRVGQDKTEPETHTKSAHTVL